MDYLSISKKLYIFLILISGLSCLKRADYNLILFIFAFLALELPKVYFSQSEREDSTDSYVHLHHFGRFDLYFLLVQVLVDVQVSFFRKLSRTS